jgi:hypothetical protein
VAIKGNSINRLLHCVRNDESLCCPASPEAGLGFYFLKFVFFFTMRSAGTLFDPEPFFTNQLSRWDKGLNSFF